MKLLIVIFSVLLAGCSTSFGKNLYLGSVVYPSKNMVSHTTTITEFYKMVHVTTDLKPVNVRSFQIETDIIVVEYIGLFKEYVGSHHWVAFRNNIYIAEGMGSAKDVEVDLYLNYIDQLRDAGKIGLAEAERRKYEKLSRIFPSSRYEDEFFKYRIVIAGQLERKEINRDMADYLLSSKSNEILSRKFSDAANLTTPYRISYQTTFAPFSCTSNRVGNSTFTNCF